MRLRRLSTTLVGVLALTVATACEVFNPLGYLQNGSNGACTPQTDPTHLVDAVAIAAHDNHTCAIRKNGQVVCWGLNTAGETGSASNGPSVLPTLVSPLPPANGVTAGGSHSCARADGGLWCWGEGADGQLGSGVELGDFSDHFSPVEVTTGGDGGAAFPVAGVLSAGGNFTCAVANGGSIWCWGLEDYGAVGILPTANDKGSTPLEVTGTQGVSLASSGASHTCVALTNGSSMVACWGLNDQLQLGAPSTGACPGGACAYNPVAPALPENSGPMKSVAAGYKHTCVVASTDVYCWGEDDNGQTGEATNNAPHVVSGFENAVAVAAGGFGTTLTTSLAETCVLEQSGAVLCFGANNRGQLGRGTSDNGSGPDGGHPDPAPVSGISNATAVAVGGSHACAIVDCGTVVCWGANDSGQLGNGTSGVDGGTSADSPTPVNVLAPLQ